MKLAGAEFAIAPMTSTTTCLELEFTCAMHRAAHDEVTAKSLWDRVTLRQSGHSLLHHVPKSVSTEAPSS
jgi:hypothetical protein